MVYPASAIDGAKLQTTGKTCDPRPVAQVDTTRPGSAAIEHLTLAINDLGAQADDLISRLGVMLTPEGGEEATPGDAIDARRASDITEHLEMLSARLHGIRRRLLDAERRLEF